jgi:hypothetical protein
MAEKATPQVSTRERASANAREPQPQSDRRQERQNIAGLLLDLQSSHGNRYVQSMLRGAVIQRKCACGGTCDSCQSNRLDLKRKSATQTEPSSMPFIMREALHSKLPDTIQPALNISQPGDAHEQEADRVADEVMRMPDTFGAHASEALPAARDSVEQHELKLERKENGNAIQSAEGFSPPGFNQQPSGGAPLEPQARTFMEQRLGHDFSHVRIHRSAEAAQSARTVNALAYTVGSNIVFGQGQYAPETHEGKRLLAHELTHVAQQGGGTHRPSLIQRQAPAGPPSPGPTPTGTGPAPTGPTPTSPPPPPGGGLSPAMLEQIARRLRQAMAGLGTDEEAIYSAFAGRTREQVDAITETYQRLYPGRNLQADLRDELTDDELQRLALFDPTNTRAGTPAEQVARQLDQAMRGLGTDESSIFAALTGRTATEITNIKTAYHNLTNRDLEADLRDEMSGAELTEALRLLNQGVLAPEDEIYLAIEGLGTDEERIFRVVDAMRGNATAIQSLDQNYRLKYGDLFTDLRGDLSGDDYERVRAVLAPVLHDVAFEDCSAARVADGRAAVAVALQQVRSAIGVLSRGWAAMSVAEQATFNRYFDPSLSGGVNAAFVVEVLRNFRSIERTLSRDYTIECESNCSNPTQYGYTYWRNIHLCPYFFTMPADDRAWGIIHETTHNALIAIDRFYFHETAGFQTLTPRGAFWSDTLNNPDSYACYAGTVGGLSLTGC